MSTLWAVAEILREAAPRSLDAREIVALSRGRLPTAALKPETVVSRDLAMELKRNGAASWYLRTAPGKFLLKEALPTAFYSDIEPYVVQWARNLIAAGQIADGVVDDRSIRDLKPADVASYRQCHFFAGIGGWSRALREAGVPDDANVWSGSCPCTPFSQAGRKQGFSDERHLWPDWFRLIAACRPTWIVGEQVASKDGLAWVDAVRSDLERSNYAFRLLDISAASVGAPHRRQRFYFAAYARERGGEILSASWLHDRGASLVGVEGIGSADGCLEAEQGAESGGAWGSGDGCDCIAVVDTHIVGREGNTTADDEAGNGGAADGSRGSELGNSSRYGAGQHGGELPGDEAQHEERTAVCDHASVAGTTYRAGDRIRSVDDPTWGGAVRGFWAADVEWIYCRAAGNQGGCFRPVESGTQPLVDGAAAELGRTRAKRLKAYGNAVVLPQAVEFIGAVIDSFAAAALLVSSVEPKKEQRPKLPAHRWYEEQLVLPATEVAAPVASTMWTGPRLEEQAPSGMLYGRVPEDRWPYGPPSFHESSCNLFPHRGSPGGLFCDCRASAADDIEYGVGA